MNSNDVATLIENETKKISKINELIYQDYMSNETKYKFNKNKKEKEIIEKVKTNNSQKVAEKRKIYLAELLPFPYYCSLKLHSLLSLNNEGFPFVFSQDFIRNEIKNQEVFKGNIIGFLGDINTGKTFLMTKILNCKLRSDRRYFSFCTHTDGLSFLKAKLENNILCIDTQGSNYPFTTNKPVCNSTVNMEQETPQEVEQDKIDYGQTKFFITNFVVTNCNVIFYTTSFVKETDRTTVNNFIRVLSGEKKIVFIIHNLFQCKSISEIDSYINDQVLKIFDLQKQNDYIYIETGANNYIAEFKHVIFGDFNNPIFDTVNQESIKYIQDQFKSVVKVEFCILKKIKEYFESFAKKYFLPVEKNYQIKLDEENKKFCLVQKDNFSLKEIILNKFGFEQENKSYYCMDYSVTKSNNSLEIKFMNNQMVKNITTSARIKSNKNVLLKISGTFVKNDICEDKDAILLIPYNNYYDNFRIEFLYEMITSQHQFGLKPKIKTEEGFTTVIYSINLVDD